MQNFKTLREKILAISPYVQNVEISKGEKGLFVRLYPNFEELEKAHIVNIESELRWYVVEVYNFEAEKSDKIISYEIVSSLKIEKSDIDLESEICSILKGFLVKFSKKKPFMYSHLELDLGLDSIDYVELFIFIQQSFGVFINEKIFSKIMILQDLCEYVQKHKKFIKTADKTLVDILQEPINKKLIYSPWIMSVYKTILYPIFLLYFRLERKGCENIPSTASIIAPSHQSMLDGFLIEGTLPYKIVKNSFFLAYKNVFGTNILKPIADNGQTILIDPNENLKETMQYSALPIKKGSNLVVFPEGARSRDRKLLEFRPFFAILSKVYNVPVVPVVIDGSFEALRSGKTFPLPKKIHVSYLKPIYPEGLSVAEIVSKTKEAIEKEMKLHPVLV